MLSGAGFREKKVRAIVLAAGKSTRFKRKKSKLLTTICGRPMVMFPLHALHDLGIPATVVVGYQKDALRAEVEKSGLKNISFAEQENSLGTGHAVLCSRETWDSENILIMNGDLPLLTTRLVKELLQKHDEAGAVLSFVSTHMFSPKGYGRVVEEDDSICVYEEKDCPEQYKDEKRVNAGIYLVKRDFLEECVSKIKKSSVSGEFYITDLISYASSKDKPVQVVPALFDEVRGVNTLQELWAVEQVMRSKLIKHWMKQGVRFELAQSIHIDVGVEIGADSFVGTGAHILGKSKIGEGCFIAAFTILEDAIVGDDSYIHSHSVIQGSSVGSNVQIGPFARLRNNVAVADNVTVGNFVEMKNSSIGEGSKTKHLSYIGDTTMGQKVNVGAGTIVCNYDGKKKHRTVIEDNSFVGSNGTLIAPVKIGKGAYVAAGSTITKDVSADDLAIARARQENKAGYAKKLGKKDSTPPVGGIIPPTGVEPCVKVSSDESKSCAKKESSLKDVGFNFLGAVKTRGGTEENL